MAAGSGEDTQACNSGWRANGARCEGPGCSAVTGVGGGRLARGARDVSRRVARLCIVHPKPISTPESPSREFTKNLDFFLGSRACSCRPCLSARLAVYNYVRDYKIRPNLWNSVPGWAPTLCLPRGSGRRRAAWPLPPLPSVVWYGYGRGWGSAGVGAAGALGGNASATGAAGWRRLGDGEADELSCCAPSRARER